MIQKNLLKISASVITIFSIIHNANANLEIDKLNLNHEVIAKYENGGKGYEAITKDNYGGYSYGKWQISTKKNNGKASTFDSFLLYLKQYHKPFYVKLMNAGGYPSAFKGDTHFSKVWVDLSRRKDFQQVYDDFILRTQIYPAYRAFEKKRNDEFDKIIAWAIEDSTVQAGVNSAIIQHGPGGCRKLLTSLVAMKNLTTKEKFLKDLYSLRKSRYAKYTKRYKSEYYDLTNNNL